MPRRFHNLKRPKVRQDWSKWNLYNLSRMTVPSASQKTFFQQKWLAKSMARGFHNPYVREGLWTRMFDRRIPAVVPMDYRYLAKNDGSELAAGRGSGLQPALPDPSGNDRALKQSSGPKKTPYMQMTFYPMERRLDTAIWRALFASSTRQARQFVTHGFVKVNGKKMIYPSYQLNPGDMFSVDPERVLFATGARKYSKDSPFTVRQDTEEASKSSEEPKQIAEEDGADEEDIEEGDQSNSSPTKAEDAKAEDAAKKPDAGDGTTTNEQRSVKKQYQDMMKTAKRIIDEGDVSGKRLQELRAFVRSARQGLSKSGKQDQDERAVSLSQLEEVIQSIVEKIPESDLPRGLRSTKSAPKTEEGQPAASSNKQGAGGRNDSYMIRKNAELLQAALRRAEENPRDATKPYATPWKPRDYMSAFAFIPRYLEVNQNICSAVYLRHPVARPGVAEAPTPFHAETMGLAFNWYLRRR